MDQAISQLRIKGVKILAYLDDLLVWSDTQEALMKDAKTTLDFLRFLGWKINLAKSRLIPHQQFQYLGLEWDLISYSVSVPKTKVDLCRKAIRRLLANGLYTVRQAQSLVGSLNFIAINSLIIKSRAKDLSRFLLQQVPKTNRDYPIPLQVSAGSALRSCGEDLKSLMPQRRVPPQVTFDAFTDGKAGICII